MTHRAEQIIDAVVLRLQASSSLGISNVFTLRSLSLAEDQGELPAVTVDFGDDTPAEEYSDLTDQVGSALEVLTTVYVVADDEPTVKQLLMAARTETHKAIDPNATLGLSFVLKVEYGGAGKPEIDTTTQQCAGSQESRWLVTYHMNISDPS